MLALSLTLVLAAAPANVRLTYEQKCLYCHSEEVSEAKKFTGPQWAVVMERMRRKAPLLINRSDIAPLTRYMIDTLKLGLAVRRPKTPRPTRNDDVELAPLITQTPGPKVAEPPAAAAEQPPPTVDDTAPAVEGPEDSSLSNQQAGFELMQRRCGRCHTLSRVYRKLDTLERSLSVLQRMRMKTGSGITDRDTEILEEYLRAQFD